VLRSPEQQAIELRLMQLFADGLQAILPNRNKLLDEYDCIVPTYRASLALR
jgi:hypothetical protein